jgi:transcriptional regulator with XRE-family HTH domain
MNWPQVISELSSKGLTQAAIAEKCSVAQSTISDLARMADRQPSYELGVKLVALLKSRRSTAKAA